jgi:hypothetical protein
MRDSRSWWTGRRVLTCDGERGTVLHRDKVRGYRRRRLAGLILAKDYLQLVRWDDGKLELVHEDYLLDANFTHTADPVTFDPADWERSRIAITWEPDPRPGRWRAVAALLAITRKWHAVAALWIVFAGAAGGAGGYALSVGQPQHVIASAVSFISRQVSPPGGSTRPAISSLQEPLLGLPPLGPPVISPPPSGAPLIIILAFLDVACVIVLAATSAPSARYGWLLSRWRHRSSTSPP